MNQMRKFSESQVTELIRRAAEHQAMARAAGHDTTDGIDEDAVRRLAQELGISESALNKALLESGQGAADSGTIKSLDRTIERSVDYELPEEALNIVCEAFQPNGGLPGSTVNLGRMLSYKSLVGMSECRITVGPRDGETILRVKSSAFLAALPTFLPALIGSLIAMAGIWEELGSWHGEEKAVLSFFVLAVIWGGAYFGFRRLVKYSNEKILRLADSVAAQFAKTANRLKKQDVITVSASPREVLEEDQDFQQSGL
jgi:hypothetical protein